MSDDFYRLLPKIELHAHLNGSVSRPCLQRIWEDRKRLQPDFDMEAPRLALADEKAGQDISSFFGHFNSYIYHLISCPSALEHATRSVLRHFEDDGVVYLELRTTPRPLPQTPFSDPLSAEDAIRLILSVISDWNASESTMKVGLILTIDQAKHDTPQAIEIANLALTLRKEGLPVVGLDLAGDPHARRDLTRLRPAFQLARDHDLDITLHFAEVPISSSRPELEELLEWQPKRLGHVIHVPEDLREVILERGIAVELCLTCNVLANMLPPKDVPGEVATIADHHFAWWFSRTGRTGSLSLGTDDFGVFGSSSSQEHRLAAEHFQLSKAEVVDISRRALRGAFACEADRNRITELIDAFAENQGI